MTANANVERLTASNAQNEGLLRASNAEVVRVTKDLATANTEISKICLKVNCLALTDADGKSLANTATEAERLEAANRISMTDKLTAYSGAVNAAAARVGVDLTILPNGGPAGGAKSAVNVLEQYNAITHPQERQAFYRKNKEAINACYRK